jgi:hypothetical protein
VKDVWRPAQDALLAVGLAELCVQERCGHIGAADRHVLQSSEAEDHANRCCIDRLGVRGLGRCLIHVIAANDSSSLILVLTTNLAFLDENALGGVNHGKRMFS